jgi:hypothetical protein
MGASEVQAFLTNLAVKENVAASTQNQALSALLFQARPIDWWRTEQRYYYQNCTPATDQGTIQGETAS